MFKATTANYKKTAPVAELDVDHPLAKGLIACWLLNEVGRGTIRNIVRSDHNGIITAGPPVWEASTAQAADENNRNMGIGMRFNNAAYVVANGSTRLLADKAYVGYAAEVWFKYIGPVGLFDDIFSKGTDIFHFQNNNGSLEFKTTQATLNAEPMTTGNTYHAVGTLLSRTMSLYMNSALRQRSTAINGSFNNSTQNWALGTAPDAGRPSNCIIYKASIWNRGLTQQEVYQLYTDPYCFIVPK